MHAIVDTDSFTFRTAVNRDDEPLLDVQERLDFYINSALDEVGAKSQELYLSGKNNFRYTVYPEYKANRVGKARPKWEPALRQYTIDQWQAIVVDGLEGDDGCGIAQYANNKKSILIHQDKDLNQLEGEHYNFVTKERYYVSAEEGIRFFYYQLLVGDKGTDNIAGVPGIGKVKATKLLAGKPVEELYGIVSDLYGSEEELDLNAKCLWIWRKQNDNWRDHVVG